MDYTTEILAFSDWLETNHMDATAQALWFHLMTIWQKGGSPEWFTVANHTLEAKLGGVSKTTLNRVRNVLLQRGRIEYKGQEKIKGGKYRLISLTSQSGTESGSNFVPDTQSGSDFRPDAVPHSIPEPVPDAIPDSIPDEFLQDRKIEGKKEGQIDGNAGAQVREENSWDTMQRQFREIFGEDMKRNHYEVINTYLDDGMQLEVILFALEEAKNNKADTPKYVWRTLGAWYTDKILTVADYVRKIQAQPPAQRKTCGNRTSQPNLSVVPGGGPPKRNRAEEARQMLAQAEANRKRGVN